MLQLGSELPLSDRGLTASSSWLEGRWGYMLWRKKISGTGPFESLPASDAGAPDTAERALDVVARLVRLQGEHAFDTDKAEALLTQARCDEWATRITLGAPRDCSVPGSGASEKARLAPPRGRDWSGLVGFMREQRRAESEYVVRSLGGFREAVLCFASCLSNTLSEERQSDVALGAQLDTLTHAIATRDAALICAEAERVVGAVRNSISLRRQRETEQTLALGERVRELREELSETRKKAEVDALTQLSNRAAFDAHLAHLASMGLLLGDAPWLMLVDLDHFKAINDNFGHPAGDEVLRQVSHCLSRTFLRKQDFVGRYGGEEFAAVLLDTSQAQMVILAERLLVSVRSLVTSHGPHQMQVTLSMGLAAQAPGEGLASWLGRADAALYRAKKQGRDRYELAAQLA
jgi:diguanylate cyclase